MITHDWLVDKGSKAIYDKSHNVHSFLCSHSTAYMVPLCIVLAPVGTLYGTRGSAAAQQASASCCKGVHLYNSPILIITIGEIMKCWIIVTKNHLMYKSTSGPF